MRNIGEATVPPIAQSRSLEQRYGYEQAQSIFLFIGTGAVFVAGCDRNQDAIDTEAHERSANIKPSGGFRGCTATAQCPNGTELSCKVKGSGTCSGTDGVGVQCITYNTKDGNPEESGGVCSK
jgi:hypothetical protein